MNFHNDMSGQNVLESDVLIVGSGPIGAVYARTILNADDSLNVLMVEMGEHPSKYTEVTGATEQRHDSNLPAAPVVREVGGMGCYWSCATPEQHPVIERSDLFSDQEWRDLYSEAKALFKTTDTAFEHSIRHRLIKDALVRTHGDREFVNLPLACRRSTRNPGYVQWTCPATILGDLADPRYGGTNFELRARHQCTRLLVDTASRQIIGAELTDLRTNDIVIAKAKKLPRLGAPDLNSPEGDEDDEANRQQGRYLTEQTMSVCQVAMKKSLLEDAWNDERCKEYFKKFPNDPLRIPPNDPSPEISTPVSEKYPWHSQIQRDPFHHNSVSNSIDPRLLIDLRFFGYVKPVYDNHVEFSSEVTDAFGMPQPSIHFRIGQEDARRAKAMMKDMKNIATSLGDYIPGGEPRFIALGTAIHICGTTRAGEEDDGCSVVDRHSKVWRLENLFIGGCGVIPTQNACNPTLTAACFALVGARKVVEEMQSLKYTRYQSKL
ncbi:hypothetical protein EsDP_00007262 [Epichloe bromicola]|uniref:Glucose-methanol-choline oxidoreductase C-terminal domain-containing protein n=1 Tax=Epichloe bromicola TaxID=79588 RepID=A0ABQ0D029_9HYPO